MPSKQRDSTQASETSARESRLNRPQTETSVSSGWGRRTFLCASSVAVAGLFAGCANIGSNGNTGDGSEPSSVDEWLAETDNYDGSITNMTGKKSVTVKVGPKENEYVFAPAAIRVAPGTTVTWKWIDSGYHNVVATGGQFKSGEPAQNATFQHTFETTGTFYYYCQPHKSMGMKGAVIVAESDRAARNTATQSEAQ